MSRYYLFNSNATHRENQKRMMLREKCISAQFNAKEKVDLVDRGDIILIYENGVGIVACGIADGRLIARDYEGWEDEEHLMHLDEYQRVSPPYRPEAISKLSRELTSTGVFFARTLSPLRPEVGDAIYCQIKRRNSEKTPELRLGRFDKIAEASMKKK